MMRQLPIVFAIMFAVLTPVGYVAAQGANRAIGFEDHQQLSDIISQYSYAWDAKETDALLALFTPDGVWQEYRDDGTKLVANYQGRAEIDRAIRPQFEGYTKVSVQSRHFQSNVMFTSTGEGTAEATNMAIITWQLLGRKEPQLSETGIYKTSFVKTSNGWKMAKRIFYSDAR
jgi:ketosteroid isomerase-like protein